MGMCEVDPFDWSLDQVVNYLCTGTSAVWTQSNLPRPNSVLLETALRENDITGEVLLTEVDKDAIVNDFGVRSLGQRATILRAIEYLQSLSPKYANHRGQAHRNVLASVAPSSVPAASFPASVHQSTAFNSSASTSPDAPVTYNVVPPHSSVNPEGRTPKFVSDPQARENEHIIIEKGGRKRRKLDLREMGKSQSLFKSKDPKQSKPRKFQYLNTEKMTMSQLFYTDIESGNDDVFLVVGNNAPPGQRKFVDHSLRHYFKQQPKAIKDKEGFTSWALFPYRKSMAPKNYPQYFTLFSRQDGEFVCTVEDTTEWPELDKRSANQFDYLLAKYAPADDQDPLPFYGDSESENGYDTDTLREIEEERVPANIESPKKLFPEEVEAVIKKCITLFSQAWHKNKLPVQEGKAWKLWRQSRRTNSVHSMIKKASNDLVRLNKRMKGLQKAIKETSWKNESELSHQCQALEPTVFNQEEQQWKISVLELQQCPPRLAIPPLSRKRVSLPKKSNKDEESLNSEDEISSGIDELILDNEEPLQNSSTLPSAASARLVAQFEGEESSLNIFGCQAFNTSTSLQKAPVLPIAVSSSSIASLQHQPSENLIPSSMQEPEIVDLTNDFDDPRQQDFEIRTPPLNPVDVNTSSSIPSPRAMIFNDVTNVKSSPSSNTSKQLTKKPKKIPDVDDVKGISLLSWILLEELRDRKRLLAKLMYSLDYDTQVCLQRYSFKNLSSCKHLRKRVWRTWRDLEDPDFLSGSASLSDGSEFLSREVTIFYICWLMCKKIELSEIPNFPVEKNTQDFASFFSQFKGVLQVAVNFHEREQLISPENAAVAISNSGGAEDTILKTKKTSSPRPRELYSKFAATQNSMDKADVDPDIDDEDFDVDGGPKYVPHKKRKRAVKESKEALASQRTAQDRVEKQEILQRRLAEGLQKRGVSGKDPTKQAVSFDTPVIYLHPFIGAQIKPYQLHGIQFMFRELIKDEKHQGCLLAHTMGLGKTMQVVSFLLTIVDAGSSPDLSIRNQIPEALRSSRSLVLCPSSLIENWSEEFEKWTPPDDSTRNNLGPVMKIFPSLPTESRLHIIKSWYFSGGVLLLSYDMFRRYISNSTTKLPLPHSEHQEILKLLLEGPNIIVADEAHKMKNRSSRISAACNQFKSKSRIALTGSPLANNLNDYYAMIDWIAPGYLGDTVQFKSKYVEPIEAGMYLESTGYQRRESLKKLQVLKKDLDPKVNRADISVIEDTLPPKIEFVITIPLTLLQAKAYNVYVESIFRDKNHDVAVWRLWDWLCVLSLLCNHPSCFLRKVEERGDALNRIANQESPDSDDPDHVVDTPGSVPVSQILSQQAIQEIRDIFQNVTDLDSAEHSYRMLIVDQILQESINIGDKVLIFSHSLPTLDFLDRLLTQKGYRFARLDGKTPISHRQAMTKQFNNVNSGMQVYLISTTAGGLGLNIPGANRVIIFDFSFNPTWEEQAVGRSYRFGQTKPVFVYRFMTGGTYQKVIHNKTVFKTQLSSRVVDKKNPVRAAVKSLSDYLFPPKEVEQEDLSGFMNKDPVLDIILKRGNHIRNVELTETFNREGDEKLTPDEERAVQCELDDERLKRNDPEGWNRKHYPPPLPPNVPVSMGFYSSTTFAQSGLMPSEITPTPHFNGPQPPPLTPEPAHPSQSLSLTTNSSTLASMADASSSRNTQTIAPIRLPQSRISIPLPARPPPPLQTSRPSQYQLSLPGRAYQQIHQTPREQGLLSEPNASASLTSHGLTLPTETVQPIDQGLSTPAYTQTHTPININAISSSRNEPSTPTTNSMLSLQASRPTNGAPGMVIRPPRSELPGDTYRQPTASELLQNFVSQQTNEVYRNSVVPLQKNNGLASTAIRTPQTKETSRLYDGSPFAPIDLTNNEPSENTNAANIRPMNNLDVSRTPALSATSSTRLNKELTNEKTSMGISKKENSRCAPQ